MSGSRSALAASSLAWALVLLDTSLINVALPAIREDLGGGVGALQWTVNAYALAFGGLLLSAGAVADRWGARRLLVAGTAVFATGSLAALAVPSIGALVAVQALLGVGAAVLVPASLALLTRTFQAPAARARALGVYASTAAVVFAAGPVIAGAVIDVAGWRAVFALNLPFVLAIALLLGTDAPAPGAGRRLDVAGQLTAIVALTALTFALIEGEPAAFAVAGLAAGAFVVVERRAAEPMLPLGLFSARPFSGALAAGVLLSVALYGQLFLLSLYLQEVRGLSATQTGLAFLAQPIMTAITGVPAGWLIGRVGARAPARVGGLLGVAGTLLLITLGSTTPYWLIVAALICIGAAAGLIVPSITTAALDGVPADKVGVASSALNAGRQTGAVLGVGILGGLVSDTDFVSGLPLAMAVCALSFAGVVAGAFTFGARANRVEVRLARAKI